MPSTPPDLIALDPDEYYAEFVGITEDGRQFFLTTPFVPASTDEPGCEYLALAARSGDVSRWNAWAPWLLLACFLCPA